MAKKAFIQPKEGLRWFGFFVTFIAFVMGCLYFMSDNVHSHYGSYLTTDAQGNVYVADNGRGQVDKFNAQGDFQASFGEDGTDNGYFKSIYGPEVIAVDRLGNVYATQSGSSDIQKFDANGKFVAKLSVVGQPRQLATDSQNNLYVKSNQSPFLFKFDGRGQAQPDWTTKVQAALNTTDSSVLLVDAQDNIYLTDHDSTKSRLNKFNPTGQLVNQQANFLNSDKLGVDQQGQLYLAESLERKIEKLDAQGHLITQWYGYTTKKEARYGFDYYRAIAVSQDSLYTLTQLDSQYKIEKLDLNGQLLKTWTVGLPRWINPFFNIIFPVGLLLIVALFGVFPGRHKCALDPLQESLPDWVAQAQTSPQNLYDHLNLTSLPPLKLQRIKSSDRRNVSDVGLTVLMIVFLIAFMVTMIMGLGKLSLGATILPALMLIAVVGIWTLIAYREKARPDNRPLNNYQRLIQQALSTLPAADRPIFINRPPAVSGLRNYLSLYVPFNLPWIILMALMYANGGDDGLPAWVVQIIVVDALIGLGLLCLWLTNALQKPGVGMVRLNRAELSELSWRFGLVVVVFDLLTLVLDNLADGLANFGPKGLVASQPSLLLFVIVFFKYGLLLVSLARVPVKWVNARLYRTDYDGALRRVIYLRRWLNITTTRLYQVNILIRAGRLHEAEYLLHEGLVLLYEDINTQNSWLHTRLGSLLAGLGRLRMEQARYAEAMFYLETALQLQPFRPAYLIALAEIYLRTGLRPSRALELLDCSGGTNGQWLTYLLERRTARYERELNRAWALAGLGRQIEADNALQYVLHQVNSKNLPALARLHYQAAFIRQAQGQTGAAIEQMRQVQQLDPQGLYGQWADKALDNLQLTTPG